MTLTELTETLKQLLSDLAFPAVCALGATMWEYHHSADGLYAFIKLPVFGQLSAYFLKLFYWGAFFATAQRALKLVRDRHNHASVIQKQEAVLARMESLATDLAGHATGGAGHCFIWNVRHNGVEITSLEISVVGDFVMQQVSMTITSMPKAKRNYQKMQLTGDTNHLFQSEFSTSFAFLGLNQIHAMPCNIPLHGPVSRYLVNWSAKNGNWTQKVEVDATDASGRPMKTVVHSHDNTKVCDPKGTELDTPEWKMHLP